GNIYIIQFKIFIMLNKSKLNLSVILLVIGIGLLPTGLFLNGYYADQVSAEVTNVLTAVEEDITQKIEDQYLGLGIYKVLPALHDNKIAEMEDEYAEIYGIPKTLLYIQNRTIELFPKIVNNSNAAKAINGTIWNVVIYNFTSESTARNLFFNNYTFEDNFSASIEGISEHMTGGTNSLNFTNAAINRLLYGRTVDETNYPGLINNLDYGTHISRWLDLYALAEADIGTNRSLMQTVYNCTWFQLQNVSEYITSYLWEDIVKPEYSPPYTIEEYAEILFYSQWVNASWKFDGINLALLPEIQVNLFGWEVGRLDPINISIDTAKNLWNPLNESTFVNDIGVWKWVKAIGGNVTLEEELKTIFQLTDKQIIELYPWLINRIKNRHVPRIYSLPPPIGIGITTEDYAEIIYLEQWANGTHLEEGLDFDYSESRTVRPNGDAGALWSYPTEGSHYENIDEPVTRPHQGEEDYIATQAGDAGLTETFDMGTVSLPSSEAEVSQIEVWIYGYDDEGTYNMTVDINMNGWQGAQNVTMTNTTAWHRNTFLINATDGTNAYLDALQVRFTAGANVNYFLNHYILTMYARVTYLVPIRGFEVGLPIKTNISLNTAFDLLDPSNKSSFIDRWGILKWIDAYLGNTTAQTEIMTTFSLDILQLNMINNWLFTTFRYIMVPTLTWDLTSTHLATYAQADFYHQWADANLFKGGIDAGPFLGLNLSEWEIGLPDKTYIDETICGDLWGSTSLLDPLRAVKMENSLVHWKGISNWFRAMQQGEYYNFLQNLYGLTDNQMDVILAWIIEIRANFAMPLAQMQANLPVDHYTWGNSMLFGFTIAGIIISALGILGVVLILVTKKR
ncbi:MAG: hypothetical protein ACFE9M_08270, partial [Promethearchaeota archaeon]